MKRMSACLLALFVFLGATLIVAQQSWRDDGLVKKSTESVYTVQSGDNLWKLAGNKLKDPTLWQKIYKQNPFLQQPGRRFEKDGIIYVLIKPGEKLFGLEELGIIPSFAPIKKFEPSVTVKTTTVNQEIPSWIWWILVVIALFLILCWLVYRMLTKDPVNSRPAIVPGGVTNQTVQVAMQQAAARASGNNLSMSQMPIAYQRFDILEQTAGRIWGTLNVRYADGREVPRRLNGERAFSARVRFPNGSDETLYMLQGCGNDLRYGGISRYLPGPKFRFEADPVAAPIVQPEPIAPSAPEPVAQQPVQVAEAAPEKKPDINESGEYIRSKDAPTPAPEPKPITRRFSVDVTSKGMFARANGFGNIRIEEDPDGTVTIRADRK